MNQTGSSNGLTRYFQHLDSGGKCTFITFLTLYCSENEHLFNFLRYIALLNHCITCVINLSIPLIHFTHIYLSMPLVPYNSSTYHSNPAKQRVSCRRSGHLSSPCLIGSSFKGSVPPAVPSYLV